jgi:hypothetical protein
MANFILLPFKFKICLWKYFGGYYDANWAINAKEALRINGNVTRNLNPGSGFWRISNVRVLISRPGQKDAYMYPEIRAGEYYENMINTVIKRNI